MKTIYEIRKILKSEGLEQYEKATRGAIHGSGYGDYIVRNQIVTTFKRYGVGYKTTRKSVKTGKIEIEVKITGNKNSEKIIEKTLNRNNISFNKIGNCFTI